MKSLVALATLLTMTALLTAAAVPLGGGVPAAVHYPTYDQGVRLTISGQRRSDRNDPLGLVVLANRWGAGQC